MNFKDVKLYCITTPPEIRAWQTLRQQTTQLEKKYIDMVELAIAGGADAIQFRDKALTPAETINIGSKLSDICHKHGICFIINDRPDIALAVNADGLHLGQDDIPISLARRILGRDKIIGKSAHFIEQALNAQTEGADYVGCGPVFRTPTKPDYAPVGLELVRAYKKTIKIPFVAIGGIDQNNVSDVVAAGAERVAVVRAVCGQKDIKNAAITIKKAIHRAIEKS